MTRSAPRIPADLLKAFAEGAHARRGGARRALCLELYDNTTRSANAYGALREMWTGGFDLQGHARGEIIGADDFTLLFDTTTLSKGYLGRHRLAPLLEKDNIMTRTAKQLAAIKASYQTDVYGPYAAEAEKNGQTPQAFDEAFAAHLTALDAADAAAPKADKVKPPKAEKPVKAPKAEKPAAGPKVSGFRASSEQRKAINTAAATFVTGEMKGTPRLLPQTKDGTYADFLQGRTLRTTDGNGSATLNVVLGRDAKVIGAVLVQVANSEMTASPVK